MNYQKIEKKDLVQNEEGYILGLVMIFFIVFTMLGLAFLKMSGFERLHVSKHHQKTKAFYYADSGIHQGMWLLNNVSKAAATFSNDSINVTYDSVTFIMKSIGTALNAQDSVKVVIVQQSSFRISSWEEL